MDRRDFIKKATMAAAGAAVISPVSAMLHQESNKKCKVLLVNGSPRTDGNTFCCLKEIEATLQKHGVESDAETRSGVRDRSDWPQARPHVYQLRWLSSGGC